MKKKKIVVIGGGSGLSSLLRGLRDCEHDVSAIVTMFDSGGSSGILRDEFGILPPGDMRRCILALSPNETEGILRKLFEHEFPKDSSLKGHKVGNLILFALASIYGSEAFAFQKYGELLQIKGKVIPVSFEKSTLCANLKNKKQIRGETHIDIRTHDPESPIKEVFLDPPVTANSQALEEIAEADLIVLGPGDLFTSIVPNLLVKGISQAIIANALSGKECAVAYVVSIMTKFGETDGYTTADYAKQILRYTGLHWLDAIIFNRSDWTEQVLAKYAAENACPVQESFFLQKYGKPVARNLVNVNDVVRHDPEKLAKCILELL